MKYEEVKNEILDFLKTKGYKGKSNNTLFFRNESWGGSLVISIEFRSNISYSNNYKFEIDAGVFIPEYYSILKKKKPTKAVSRDSLLLIEQNNKTYGPINKHNIANLLGDIQNDYCSYLESFNGVKEIIESLELSQGWIESIVASILAFKNNLNDLKKYEVQYNTVYNKLNDYWREKINYYLSTFVNFELPKISASPANYRK